MKYVLEEFFSVWFWLTDTEIHNMKVDTGKSRKWTHFIFIMHPLLHNTKKNMCKIIFQSCKAAELIWTFGVINLSIMLKLRSAVVPLRHTASHGGLRWRASLLQLAQFTLLILVDSWTHGNKCHSNIWTVVPSLPAEADLEKQNRKKKERKSSS